MDDKEYSEDEYIDAEDIEDIEFDPEDFEGDFEFEGEFIFEDDFEYDFEDQDFEDSEYTTKRSFMMKPVAILVLITFILLAFPNVYYHFSDRLDFLDENKALREDEIVNQVRAAVVSVEAGQRQGTGFNISPEGIIITNEHIVEDATSIVVRFDNGQSFISHQYQVVSGVDVAIIHLSGDNARNLPVVEVNKEDQVQNGDTVTIIGNPLGFEQISQRGSVGNLYKVRESQHPIFDIKISISPGNSGSPVINENAEVVGIVYASAYIEKDDNQEGSDSQESESEPESVALAIPIQVLPPLENTGQ